MNFENFSKSGLMKLGRSRWDIISQNIVETRGVAMFDIHPRGPVQQNISPNIKTRDSITVGHLASILSSNNICEPEFRWKIGNQWISSQKQIESIYKTHNMLPNKSFLIIQPPNTTIPAHIHEGSHRVLTFCYKLDNQTFNRNGHLYIIDKQGNKQKFIYPDQPCFFIIDDMATHGSEVTDWRCFFTYDYDTRPDIKIITTDEYIFLTQNELFDRDSA